MNIFLQRALELAKQAGDKNEVPVGAVLVQNGTILAEAHNGRETFQDPLGHAEILALKKGAEVLKSWRLESCVLYTTLEPCLMCMAAMQQSRIHKVVFAASDLKGGALSLGYRFHDDPRLNHRMIAVYEPHLEASLILTNFFKSRRVKKS